MDFDFLDLNTRNFGAKETSKTKMTNETIVVFVVLVREFVPRVGFFVLAFGRVQFGNDVFNRVHRLERDRKQYGDRGDEVE
jgi:hypothetical protein